jgi:hypothetical protein
MLSSILCSSGGALVRLRGGAEPARDPDPNPEQRTKRHRGSELLVALIGTATVKLLL